MGIFKSLGKALGGLGKGLSKIGGSVFKAAGTLVKTSVGLVGKIGVPAVLGVASGGLAPTLLGGVVGKIFGGGGSAAAPIVASGGGVLAEAWNTVKDTVKDTVVSFGDRIAGTVSGAVDRTQEFVQDAAAAAGRALSDIGGAGHVWRTKVVIFS